MHTLTKLIKKDMKPALGVTEPGAIAFAVASARKNICGKITNVQVRLNSGMYKNAYTCGIPNAREFGNLHAAALGAVAANAELGLESLRDITEEDNTRASELVQAGKVEAILDHIGSEITIEARVCTDQGECKVFIKGSHTDIRKIIRDGDVIYEKEGQSDQHAKQVELEADIHHYTLHEILEYIDRVSLEELEFEEEACMMDLELLKEGLASDRTTIGPMLFRENQNNLFSADALKSAQLLCNGAIEARVLGLSKPAMSITGSGAHGIIAVMPLYAVYKVEGCSKERLLRGIALSCLITMYIKEYSGKLSAFCGCGIAAGTGMACGLAYMREAEEKKIGKVIQNMASGLTGMICDGGNQGCAMKGIVAVDAAFRSVDMALNDVCIDNIHGINGKTPEETMHNMGLIASPGMVHTEETIVDIMKEK